MVNERARLRFVSPIENARRQENRELEILKCSERAVLPTLESRCFGLREGGYREIR